MIRPDQSAATGGVNVGDSVGGSVIIGYTIEQHEAALDRQEARIRADLERAHAAERALLQSELDEVCRRMVDLEGSFETRRRELAEAEAALRDMGDGLPQAKLDAALAALAKGDSGKAEALFAQVQAMEAAGVARAARAAHELGKLAAADIRWADAARHHAEAARLVPSFDHLLAARELAWLSGDFPNALRFGEDLVKAAVAEHGDGTPEHATALNEHAVTLQATGRHAEAEPLYRQALAIRAKALGEAHPDHATDLNNLAALLRDTGRHAEAEPLLRQALAIRAKAVGEAHPTYATSLNNLAGLLRATGRHAEAEPLHRQALAILIAALGAEHPSTRTVAANLATLSPASEDGFRREAGEEAP